MLATPLSQPDLVSAGLGPLLLPEVELLLHLQVLQQQAQWQQLLRRALL